jgi:hypothetical protein
LHLDHLTADYVRRGLPLEDARLAARRDLGGVAQMREACRVGELVGLYSHDRTQADSYRIFSYPNYADIRDRADVFDGLAAHTFAMAGMPAGDITRRVFVEVVSSNPNVRRPRVGPVGGSRGGQDADRLRRADAPAAGGRRLRREVVRGVAAHA